MARRRLWLGSVLAPPAAVVACWAGAMVAVALGYGRAPGDAAGLTVAGAGHALFFFLFFGVPVAYAGSIVAVLGYALLRRGGWLTVRGVVGGGALLGAGLVPLAWALLWGHADGFAAVLGVFAGAAAGLTFWSVALRETAQRADV